MASRLARSAAVHSRRNLWRDIVDSIADAVIVVDKSLKPVAVNPAAETMLGMSPVSDPVFLNIVRQNEWIGRMLRSCLETGQNFGDPEATFNIGPRATTVRAEVSPLTGLDGHSDGAVIVLHDLAHQRSAEQAVEAADAQLRLSPAGLAHEVKNPLTGIKGAAELLGAMYPADQRARQYCELILGGVERITSLVEQVLAVSGPQRLRRDEINIHRVLHGALRMAGLYPAPPAEMKLIQEFDPSLPDLIGDDAALERAFLNLIRNALEAMNGRGTLKLRTRMETEFRLTAEGQRRQFLRVEVIDNGPGMSEEQVQQLFTPFFTTKSSGSGLGLVLSQRTIALHGGKLWAERGGVDGASSKNPRGMTFKITLPVKIKG